MRVQQMSSFQIHSKQSTDLLIHGHNFKSNANLHVQRGIGMSLLVHSPDMQVTRSTV